MEGDVPLEEVYAKVLSLLRCTKADLQISSANLAPVLVLAVQPQEYESCQGTPHQALFDKGMTEIFEGYMVFNHRERKRSFYASYQAVYPWTDRGTV